MKYRLQNNRKDQWNQELVLWKDEQNQSTFIQAHQEEKRDNPNNQNKKLKRRYNNQYHRDTKKKKKSQDYEQLHANKFNSLEEMD